MRITVHHSIKLLFDAPVYGLTQILRLTPCNHSGQFVRSWRIETSEDSRLSAQKDAFGNLTHSYSFHQELQALEITTIGEAAVEDKSGLVREAVDRLPRGVYLRSTDLTRKGRDIVDLCQRISDKQANPSDPLSLVHYANTALFERFSDSLTADIPPVGAEQALSKNQINPVDLSHILITALRHLGFPARMVSGYHAGPDETLPDRGWHSWAEVHIGQIGWVGLDPAQGLSPTERYIRTAIGLDYLDVMPLRAAQYLMGSFSVEQNAHVVARQF